MSKRIDEIKRRASAAAQKGARAIREGARAASEKIQMARQEISRIDSQYGVSRKLSEAASRAAASAKEAAQEAGIADKVERAQEVASDLLGQAQKYYEGAASAARAASGAARLPASMLEAMARARQWIKQNPGKAAAVGISFAAGVRAGSAFPSLDVTILGAGSSGNWFFHSAIAPYVLRRLLERYEAHLKRQEELINKGEVDQSERERLEFERDLIKYVGAPLLGAFSAAVGAGLIKEALAGAVVTGFPIDLILGGNRLLSSIWLFGNGVVCLETSYKFFMVALADQEQVARMVRDIKALLPRVN